MWRITLATLFLGAFAGATLWVGATGTGLLSVPEPQPRTLPPPVQLASLTQAPVLEVDLALEAEKPLKPPSVTENAAIRYARAVQEGDCDAAIDATEWMQDRLEMVQLYEHTQEAYQQERERLCEGLQTRQLEGNRIEAEGIEDQYIFRPGARLSLVGIEEGNVLESGQGERDCVWIQVMYPSRLHALRDGADRPIHSVIVGVHLSEEGRVLKADVVGNVEIQQESIVLFDPDYEEEPQGADYLSTL